MNDPVRVGEVIGQPREPVRIPKHCPECGKDYDGYSFIGLRPGEARAIYPCDDCQQQREEKEKARFRPLGQRETPPEPTELHRPERTRADWDG